MVSSSHPIHSIDSVIGILISKLDQNTQDERKEVVRDRENQVNQAQAAGSGAGAAPASGHQSPQTESEDSFYGYAPVLSSNEEDDDESDLGEQSVQSGDDDDDDDDDAW